MTRADTLAELTRQQIEARGATERARRCMATQDFNKARAELTRINLAILAVGPETSTRETDNA